MRRVVAGRLLLFSTAVYAGLTLGGILAVYLGWDWITDTPERATVISGAAGAFFVSLGLIFVAIQFIQTEKQRHWDSTSDLVSSWDSSEMRQCRAAIMAVVNAGNSLATKLQETERNAPSAYLELMVVGQFFEHLGFAVEKGAIAENTIKELLGATVTTYFDDYREYKDAVKKDQPALFKYFEKLAERCR